jgi:NAD(P)-dependent dehydrogenase (short-subunit alcohol dehydrogenase family)
MNDVIRLAAEQASIRFGSCDGTFNAAGFANTLARIAGLERTDIDGLLVRAILAGRPDIEVLSGAAHYRLR